MRWWEQLQSNSFRPTQTSYGSVEATQNPRTADSQRQPREASSEIIHEGIAAICCTSCGVQRSITTETSAKIRRALGMGPDSVIDRSAIRGAEQRFKCTSCGCKGRVSFIRSTP